MTDFWIYQMDTIFFLIYNDFLNNSWTKGKIGNLYLAETAE